MMELSVRRLAALALSVVLAGACRPAPSPAVPTAAPLFRAEPLASPTVPSSPTPTTPAPNPGVPTANPSCQNDARFVADVTIPDGTIVSPGAAVDKRWSVLNAGTCDWVEGYSLVRVGAGAIDGPAELALFPARAGATAELRADLHAPEAPGEYLARWRARAPDGSLFGEEIFVLIFVEEPTDTPSPTALPTP